MSSVMYSTLIALVAWCCTGSLCWMGGYLPTETECPNRVDLRIYLSGSQIEFNSSDRALHTVPRGFSVRQSSIPGAGRGAFADTFLKANTWLGEYEGVFITGWTRKNKKSNDYAWVVRKHGLVTHFVDASDIKTSNWLRFVNCARHVCEQNVISAMCFGRIHYLTTRDVGPGTELLVDYGTKYAQRLGIDVNNYHKGCKTKGYKK